jgi:putative transposase
MKHSRFSHQQIARILKECEAGKSVAEVCQEHGISSSTIYSWRTRYESRSEPGEMQVLNLEIENRRLKQRLDEISLDFESLKGEMRRLRNREPQLG